MSFNKESLRTLRQASVRASIERESSQCKARHERRQGTLTVFAERGAARGNGAGFRSLQYPSMGEL